MRSSAFLLCFGVSLAAFAQTNQPNQPTWWSKYQYLLQNGSSPDKGKASVSVSVGGNVNVSNECGPQSETYVAINPSAPAVLAGGSNEIYRLPMRGYYSADAGLTWGGVDLPLPAVKGTNGIVFGSDPTLAFDTQGNVFYGYILVYFSAGNGINGTQMAVVRSSDGGKTYPNATFFAYEGGQNHFNDKPMITADASLASPYRDNVYIAWDAASGGSSGGGVRLARSSDHGATFSIARVDQPSGPGRAIGAVPFTGPNGEVYVAWNDYASGAIAFNRSFDGGATWDTPGTVALKTLAFDIALPAEFSRGALQYPSCAADTSKGRLRGRLYCSWMDITSKRHDGHFRRILRRPRNHLEQARCRYGPSGDPGRPVQSLARRGSCDRRGQRFVLRHAQRCDRLALHDGHLSDAQHRRRLDVALAQHPREFREFERA